MLNTEVRLRSRPQGVAQADNFEIVRSAAPEPAVGEIVVRNQILSVEPAMRGWIADANNYSQPVPVGSVMRALAAGEVIATRSNDFAVGDRVMGWFGWQEVAVVPALAVMRKVTFEDLPLSLSLGVLGLNGITALLALRKLGEPVAGDTIVVSTAAGAVGSIVGQLAHSAGCRTVGITSGTAKMQACTEQFGYDVALSYREPRLREAIAAACPDGVNIYFDNTAGPISDSVMPNLALNGRVIVCGTAAIADWSVPQSGPRVDRHLLVKRARMQGFVVFDHAEEFDQAIGELAARVRAGDIAYREHFLEGLEACPDALAMLYRGENDGKLLVRLPQFAP